MNQNENENNSSEVNSPTQAEEAGRESPESNLKARRSSAFAERRQARIDRLRDRAERRKTEGQSYFKRADSIASFIPMGQPILVGHHSEKRHRRDIERMDNSMRKGIGALDEAKRLEGRAYAAENNSAIFTEDPDAKEKLEAKIAGLEKKQAHMREVNKRIRSGKSLADLGISEADEKALRTPDFLKRIGYADYELKNNNANIRRLKLRLGSIAKVQAMPAPEDIEKDGIRIVENVEDNRVQIFFPASLRRLCGKS